VQTVILSKLLSAIETMTKVLNRSHGYKFIAIFNIARNCRQMWPMQSQFGTRDLKNLELTVFQNPDQD